MNFENRKTTLTFGVVVIFNIGLYFNVLTHSKINIQQFYIFTLILIIVFVQIISSRFFFLISVNIKRQNNKIHLTNFVLQQGILETCYAKSYAIFFLLHLKLYFQMIICKIKY